MGCLLSKPRPAASSPTPASASGKTVPPEPEAGHVELPDLPPPLEPPPTDKFSNAEPPTASDELDWVTAPGAATDKPASWAIAVLDGAKAAGSGVDLAVRVQVNLEGTWRDSSPDEVSQVCEHVAKGERSFVVQARGQSYLIELDGPGGPAQVNEKTGKRRKLRIVDAVDVGAAAVAEGDRSEIPNGSKRNVSPEVEQQREWGAQSRRGGASQHPLRTLDDNPHAKECFAKFADNEQKLCAEWAVFYHSYSFAALIYEVHAAVGAVLFRFRSQYATLPRILVHEFNAIPNAVKLMENFRAKYATCKRDHHPEFRAVAVSVMCSLVSTGPEACPPCVFIAGYSCRDLAFRSVLENLLERCYVPKAKVRKLADDIIALSETHGLDVSQFGGKPCKSGKAGHLMQIFLRRDLVDQLVYPAKPYGLIDEERLPVSKWVNSNASFSIGQARIVAHPKYFMQANCVRCYVASADPTFHKNRAAFQDELTKLLNVILGAPDLRERAATGIFGGKLPHWWTHEDQRAKSSGAGLLDGSPSFGA